MIKQICQEFFLSMCDVKIFLIYVTDGTALTTIPILFLYLNTVTVDFETGGLVKSDSTHHFFRNACTKSGSLRFSQFSGC